MNNIENLKNFPSKPETNITGKERMLFVNPKSNKKGTTPPITYTTLDAIAAFAGGGGSGTVSYENIEFSDFHAKLINSDLTPLQWYRITDYKSVNFLNGYNLAYNNPTPIDPSFDPRQLHIGQEEVLLVQALSNNEISPIAYSEEFSNDIIHFNPYISKLGLATMYYNSNTLPDGITTISGFDLQWDGTNVYFEMPTGYPALYGNQIIIQFSTSSDFYVYFIEILKPENDNVSSTIPSRVKVENNGQKIIFLDLPESIYNDYQLDSLYVFTNYEFADMPGYISRREDTLRKINVPFDFRNRVYRRYEVDLSGVLPLFGNHYVGIGDNWNNYGTTGNYIDVPSIDYKQYSTYNVYIEGYSSPFVEVMCDNVFLERIISFKAGVTFNNNTFLDVENTIVGNEFYNNTFVYGCYETTIKNYSDYNLIYDSNNNEIDSNFSYNVIGDRFNHNKIGADSTNNQIQGTFQNNRIFDGFYFNTIGTDFTYNKINSTFNSNQVNNGFCENIINANTNGFDFTSATLVYNDYTKTIFRNTANNLRLSYIDGTDTIVYDDIDA
jgi:hypothetical protein